MMRSTNTKSGLTVISSESVTEILDKLKTNKNMAKKNFETMLDEKVEELMRINRELTNLDNRLDRLMERQQKVNDDQLKQEYKKLNIEKRKLEEKGKNITKQLGLNEKQIEERIKQMDRLKACLTILDSAFRNCDDSGKALTGTKKNMVNKFFEEAGNKKKSSSKQKASNESSKKETAPQELQINYIPVKPRTKQASNQQKFTKEQIGLSLNAMNLYLEEKSNFLDSATDFAAYLHQCQIIGNQIASASTDELPSLIDEFEKMSKAYADMKKKKDTEAYKEKQGELSLKKMEKLSAGEDQKAKIIEEQLKLLEKNQNANVEQTKSKKVTITTSTTTMATPTITTTTPTITTTSTTTPPPSSSKTEEKVTDQQKPEILSPRPAAPYGNKTPRSVSTQRRTNLNLRKVTSSVGSNSPRRSLTARAQSTLGPSGQLTSSGGNSPRRTSSARSQSTLGASSIFQPNNKPSNKTTPKLTSDDTKKEPRRRKPSK